MPIYEFKCNDCDSVTTEFRKIGDVDPAECCCCGSKKTEKMMSPFASRKQRFGSAPGCKPSGGG